MVMPRISIATPGVNQDGPIRKRTKTSFVPRGAVRVGSNAVDIDHKIEVDANGNTLDHTIVSAALCFGCGRVFASNQDVGGACSSCGFLLGAECLSEFRCAACRLSSCPRCGEQTDEGFVCRRCRVRGRRPLPRQVVLPAISTPFALESGEASDDDTPQDEFNWRPLE